MSQANPSRSVALAAFRGIVLYGILFTTVALVYLISLPLLCSRRGLRFGGLLLGMLAVRSSLFFSGVRVRVHGIEHYRAMENGPFILVSNHESTLDTLIQMQAMHTVDLAYLAKIEIIRIPVIGRLLEAIGWIGVDRSSIVAAKRLIESIQAKVKTGWVPHMVVFPEGTRSPDGQLLTFHSGAFLLSTQLGIPILPVVIRGSGQIQPKHSFKVYSGTVDVYFKPLALPCENPVPRIKIPEVTQELKQRVEQLFEMQPPV